MSAAILHDLGHLEVALRNAYDTSLARVPLPAGAEHWTQAPATLFVRQPKRAKDGTSIDANDTPRRQVLAARRAAGGPNAPGGKVVAEFSFGFWRYLSTSAHEVPLWRPYLHHAFQPGTSRRDLDQAVRQLHLLRNRVAHHENLLTANLAARHDDVGRVLAMISAQLEQHVAGRSTWASVLTQRP
ncbi:hypothetical protein AB2L28_05930 [Kineococcus sp. TBRC 1896]|uniref:Abi-like protein n=1 Tax=Kineococcus mangrovi TaxID=1660183 RepID=A0ABV4HZD0_9ACTN